MLKNRWTAWIGFIVAILLAGCGTIYFLLHNGQAYYDNLKDVQAASRLIVILPKTLPVGSVVTDHPSYDSATESIITRINISGHYITFTQQRRPSTDLKQVDAAETFLVNAGSVYVLKGEEGRMQAIVETSDSWLMINGDVKLGVTMFKEVLESLDAI